MNNSIMHLRGPEGVRKRPAVIFGDAGVTGAVSAIKSLLDIFVTEAALGFSSGIDVTIRKDNSISVRSYDRGFKLDEAIIEGKPAWYNDFCVLYADPREPDEKHYFSLGSHHNDLYGKSASPMPNYQADTDHTFDLCCVQCASAFMHIEATRDGIRKILDFEKGYSVSDMRKEETAQAPNTYIHFLMDAEVFGDVRIPGSEIKEFLRDTAMAIPGLKCKLCDERDDRKCTFLYLDGAKDHAKKIATSLPLFSSEIEATGKDRYNQKEYDAKVKLTFGFAEDSATVMCLHNYRRLTHDGLHLDAVKERLMHYINREFKDAWSPGNKDNYISGTEFKLSFDDIMNHVVLILETNCSKYASDYRSAARTAIKNRMIADMSSDLIAEDFEHYLQQNHNGIFAILKNVQQNKKKL